MRSFVHLALSVALTLSVAHADSKKHHKEKKEKDGGMAPVADKPRADPKALNSLTLACSTPNADVLVDGEKIGQAPIELPLPVANGSHTLKVIKLGFAPYIDVFTAKPGTPVKLEVELQARLISLQDAPVAFLPALQQRELVAEFVPRLRAWTPTLLARMMAGVSDVAAWLVYLALLPVLVFFFLKDKDLLLASFTPLLPKDRELIDKIWADVEEKTASYVRGTLWRMLIVGLVTGAALIALGFDYGALMGALTALSVLIPYVGAIAVMLPLALLGYAQWGLTWDLGYLLIAYGAIQALDGYVLVPLLFSVAVKLHPVTILLATFVFGNLWGFWGLIFAIPLATLVKSFLLTVIEHQDKLA